MMAKKILAIALDSSPPRLIIELAWRLGWTVRVYDFDLMLRSFKWLQKLEADGRVERVLIPPKGDAYSRAIGCAIAAVDAGVGRSVTRALERLYGTTQVNLLMKRILAEQLSRQLLMLDLVNKTGTETWIWSCTLKEILTILTKIDIAQVILSDNVWLLPSPPSQWRVFKFIHTTAFLIAKGGLVLLQLFRRKKNVKYKAPIAWSLSSAFQVRFSGSRRFDLIIDDATIKNGDVVFLLETASSPAIDDALRGGNVTIYDTTRELSSSNYLKGNFYGLWVLNFLCSLPTLLLSGWNYTFASQALKVAVSNYMYWEALLTKFEIGAYVYTNKETVGQIAGNLVLHAHGIRTISFSQYMGGPYLLKSPPYDCRHVYWAFLNPTIATYYNEINAHSFMEHPQMAERYEAVGSIFADRIKNNSSNSTYREKLLKHYSFEEKNPIVAIFDTTYVDMENFIATFDVGVKFMNDIIHLVERHPDWCFVFKASKDDYYYENPHASLFAYGKSENIVALRHKLRALCNARVVPVTEDPADVITVADAVITACFSTPVADAVAAGKYAFWYDPNGECKDYPFAQLKGMYVCGPADLEKNLQDIITGNARPYSPDDIAVLVGPANGASAEERLRELIVAENALMNSTHDNETEM